MNNRIEVVEGNIVRQNVDAIVNAANESLLGGGGVDGAIHAAAGPELLEECKKLNGCLTGHAKITKAYRLPAKWVIHTVGPVWRGGLRGEDNLLTSCYRSTLNLANQYQIKTIAFPSISTGLYRFPMNRAAKIALTETLHALGSGSTLSKVIFVCYGRDAFHTYMEVVREMGIQL